MKKFKLLSLVGLAVFVSGMMTGSNLNVSAEPPENFSNFSSPAYDVSVPIANNLFSDVMMSAKNLKNARDIRTKQSCKEACVRAAYVFLDHFNSLGNDSKKYVESLILVNILRAERTLECVDTLAMAKFAANIYKNVRALNLVVDDQTGRVHICFEMENIPGKVRSFLLRCLSAVQICGNLIVYAF